MEPLPPIPTPSAQRWREFRIQVLPLIIFVSILVAVVFLWRSYIQPVGVIGEVEAVKGNVTGLADGLLNEVYVDLFQYVTNGQVIGTIIPSDADALRAEIVTAEADLKVLEARTEIDERRRAQDYQQLVLDHMKEKVAVAIEQAQLFQKSNAYVRALNLSREDKIYSPEQYDLAKSEFEMLGIAIKERSGLIEKMAKDLERLDQPQSATSKKPIEEAINAKRLELETLAKPTQLRAPIDGFVSTIYRRPGEKVTSGEPIVTISATTADRIVGYVRQPIGALPNTNDTVVVRTRAQPPKVSEGKILQVGGQMQSIPTNLLSLDTTRMESGLPILVSLPHDLNVIPGELVDLSIKRAK